MTAKEKVRQLLERLPDDVTLEQIQYHLCVQQKIEHALASALEGELLNQEEVERHMTKWTTF